VEAVSRDDDGVDVDLLISYPAYSRLAPSDDRDCIPHGVEQLGGECIMDDFTCDAALNVFGGDAISLLSAGAHHELKGSSSYRQKCCCIDDEAHGGQLDCNHKNAFPAAVHGVS
jgi:hypothetical protein